ncbi:MAG: zinc ribbon domain-containing protein [Actinobacteria bacterium]|nr:zinc ribbon domain-containing protein [Actinomycetota bacterium]
MRKTGDYCPRCGDALAQECPNCGQSTKLHLAFCRHCGHSF